MLFYINLLLILISLSCEKSVVFLYENQNTNKIAADKSIDMHACILQNTTFTVGVFFFKETINFTQNHLFDKNNEALWHCMWCTHYSGTPPYITRHFSASLTRQRYSSVWVTPLWLESSAATPDVNSVGQCYWRIISIFAGHNLPIWSIYGAIVIDRKYSQIQVF